jgi:hypothetical protein
VRAELQPALIERALKGPPLLLTGPPGAGKTTLLLQLCERLLREGHVPVYLDLFGAAASPQRFVASALHALRAESFASRLGQAMEMRRLAEADRTRGGEAVEALFRLWTSLDETQGRRVVLLLDEATEIRSLAYFKGLRDVAARFGAALSARRRGTILATSFPTAARSAWSFETLPLPPLGVEALRPLFGSAAGAVARASFGWPRYLRVFLDAPPRSPAEVAASWASEMSPGGRLETLARATHESLLLRSRGYGISKAVLQIVALEEGLTLTQLVPRVGRTAGATRDYLQWLVAVDALRMMKKRYAYVDGLLRHWVRLHGRGAPASRTEIEATAHALAFGEQAAGPTPEAVVAEPLAAKRDSLIEID